jgi:hypothetical protein
MLANDFALWSVLWSCPERMAHHTGRTCDQTWITEIPAISLSKPHNRDAKGGLVFCDRLCPKASRVK